MPNLDGWGAIGEPQRRRQTAAIPIIVLTGHDFGNYLKAAALTVGARSFLKKPCFPEQLAMEIQRHLCERPAGGGVAAS